MGIGIGQARRPRQTEKENNRFKRQVADLSPSNQILKDSFPGDVRVQSCIAPSRVV